MSIQDQADALTNAENFLHQVLETKQVFALKHEQGGWASCESKDYEDTAIFLFWSTSEQAETHCVEDWKDYQPVEITLDDFINVWLQGLDKEDHMIGMNWEKGLFGLEVEPLDIAKKLESGDL